MIISAMVVMTGNPPPPWLLVAPVLAVCWAAGLAAVRPVDASTYVRGGSRSSQAALQPLLPAINGDRNDAVVQWISGASDDHARRDSGLTFTELEMASAGGGGVCSALQTELCDPCYKVPTPPAFCEPAKEQCEMSFCLPLCMRLTWGVEVTSTGSDAAFNSELTQVRVSNAINAQLLAHGCESVLGCCPKNDQVLEWVEHRTYGGYFPTPLVPMAACRAGDGGGNQCTKCKVKVKVVEKAKACDYFVDPPPIAEDKDASKVFSANGVSADTEVPKHGSLKARCLKLQEKLKAKKAALESELNKVVCGCLGCCPDVKCPFAVVYKDNEEALAADGQE